MPAFFICQLPEFQQQVIRKKLKQYMLIEGFVEGEELEQELQNAMDGKIDDVDWANINRIINQHLKFKR